jgi:hypothetical protein
MPKQAPSQSGAVKVPVSMRSPSPISLKTIRDALPNDILGKIVAISKKQFKTMENPLNHPDLLEFGETIKTDERIPRLVSNSIYDLETLVTLPPGKKYEVRVRIMGLSPTTYNIYISMYRKSLIGASLKKIALYTLVSSGPNSTSEVLVDSKISEVEERAFYSVYAHVAKALRHLPIVALKFPKDTDYVTFGSEGYVKKHIKDAPFKSRVSELYTTPKSTQYLHTRSVVRSASKPTAR